MNVAERLALLLLVLCCVGCCMASSGTEEKIRDIQQELIRYATNCSPVGLDFKGEICRQETSRIAGFNYYYLKDCYKSDKIFNRYIRRHQDHPRVLSYLRNLQLYKNALMTFERYKKRLKEPEVKEIL